MVLSAATGLMKAFIALPVAHIYAISLLFLVTTAPITATVLLVMAMRGCLDGDHVVEMLRHFSFWSF